MSKLWDSLTGGFADVWTARAMAPALAFWLGGLFCLWKRIGGTTLKQFSGLLPDAETGVALAVAGGLLLLVSNALVQTITLPVLRLAEGYWPSPLKWLKRYFVGRISRRYAINRARWSELARARPDLDDAGREESIRLDLELNSYPVQAGLRLPTRLGNVLRAAEEYPTLRYGLEITTVWPRLWLLLPDAVREEITSARQSLDQRIQIMIWSVLFVVWTTGSWWALPIGLLAAAAAYRNAVTVAGVYGELLRAIFDLHRFELYEALRWKLPEQPANELATGTALCAYLLRGTCDTQTRFQNASSSDSGTPKTVP